MDQNVVTSLQPYGAWYTVPGGLQFERNDHARAADAAERLAALRNNPRAEPRYSHGRVVFILVMIGFLHVPATAFQFVFKGLALGWDRVDTWTSLALLPVAGIFFVFAALAHFRPPQRAPVPMFKSFLRGAIGMSRGTAYRMLLNVEREQAHPRCPPPKLAGKGADQKPVLFNEQGDFERYWIGAFGGGFHPYKTTSFRNVQTAALAPDLVVVQADVRVTSRSFVAHLLAFAPLVIGAILTGVGAFVVAMLIASQTLEYEAVRIALLALFAPLALGVLAAIIMTIKSLIPIARVKFPVRKLIVRVNDQWRVFNGELQSAEELDIHWALAPEARAADAA